MAGSPPRAWGRQVPAQGRRIGNRFTPTCVGTASPCRWMSGRLSVHPPRAWGRRRHSIACIRPRSVHPHVRGDGENPEFAGELIKRFTPTCVGTAALQPRRVSRPAVHPHVRGDGKICCCQSWASNGSPPRAWGRRDLSNAQIGAARFTPTCVGTAGSGTAAEWRVTVHPHVRGDGFPVLAKLRVFPRFTPTCVGTA